VCTVLDRCVVFHHSTHLPLYAGIGISEIFESHVPKPLWDVVWRRLRGSGDFLTLNCPGSEVGEEGWSSRSVLPLSSITCDCVRDIDPSKRIVASQEAQEAFVGVYANRVQRNAYSEMQIGALVRLTKCGVEGMPQSELTKQLESKGNNFGYVVKVLMERGKIFNKKVTLKFTSGGPATQTSMLYLSKYKPRVEAALRVSKSKKIQIDGKICEIFFEDDEELMKNVLKYLGSPEGVLETDLKKAAGFKQSAGHKLWRRIKQKMIEEGLIEEMKCRIKQGDTESNGTVIKKIKELESEIHEPSVSLLVTKPPRLPMKQFVELSLDKQVLYKLVTSGAFGVTSADISAELGLNLKKHTLRFSDLQDRFQEGKEGIERKKVTIGKSTQMAFIPSSRIRDAFKHSHAIFFDGDTVEDDDVDRTAIDMEDVEKPDFPVPEGEDAKNEVFMKRYIWLCQAIIEQGFFLSQQAGSLLLEKEKVWAQQRGRAVPKEIDHKTVNRLVAAATKLKVIEATSITAPGKLTGTSQMVTVFVPYGTKSLDEALNSQIIASYTESFKNRAKKKDENDFELPVVTNIPSISQPGIDGMQSKAQSFNNYNIQKENGYHSSKLLRCQDVSETVCSMLDARMGDFCSEGFKRLMQAASRSDGCELRELQEIPGPRSDDNGSEPPRAMTQSISSFYSAPDRNRRVFVLEEVWDSLTVDTFLRALGSSCSNKPFINSIKDMYLSELSEENLEKLAGPSKSDLDAARQHLRDVLSMLFKLGVVKQIVTTGTIADVDQSTTYYMMNSSVSHQLLWFHKEPVGADMLTFDFTDRHERRGYWNSLQYLFAMKKVQLDSMEQTRSQSCFPVNRVNIDKSLGRLSYSKYHKGVEELKQKIVSGEINLEIFRREWGEFARLSDEHNMPVEIVVRVLADLQKIKSSGPSGKSGRRPKESRTRSRSRNKNAGRGLGVDLYEEEEQFILLQPESMPTPMRKRKWLESEDRELLYGWVAWVAEFGGTARLKIGSMKLPQGIRVQSCANRLQKLMVDAHSKDTMDDIRKEADAVHQRHVESQPLEVSMPPVHRGSAGGELFELRSDEDLESLKVIADHIERVVQGASERPAEGAEGVSSRFERLSKAKPDGSNPMEFYAWLRTYVDKYRSPTPEPSVEVTAALSCILSCLYEVEFLGKSEDAVKSLFHQKRFSNEIMKSAVKFLDQNGLIELSSGDSPMMCLSERYREGARPTFAPLLLNESDAVISESQSGTLWPLPPLSNPLSLSPLYTLCVMGDASLHVEVPRDVLFLEGDKADNELIGLDCLHRNMASITISPSYAQKVGATSSHGEGKHASSKFEPGEVLKSSEKHREAKEAFSLEVKKALGVDAGSSILKAIVDAGANGVSLSRLKSLLEHNKLNATPKGIRLICDLLQEYGLARVIGGYNEMFVVNVMTSEHLVVNEVPLRPWIDSKGRLIKPLWESVVLKLIDMASRIPGIRGDYLLASLKIFPPHFAREIVTELCKNGILHCCRSLSGPCNANHCQEGIWDETPVARRSPDRAIPFESTAPFGDSQLSDSEYCFFVHAEKALLQNIRPTDTRLGL
jgi:hypothetical protein